jgi:Cd2+/Zn2+-exporting ATPase
VNTLKLQIEGLTCAGCANTVQTALAKVPGVQSARVNHLDHLALITFDPAQANETSLLKAIADAGYRGRLPAPDRPAEERAEVRRAFVRVGLVGGLLLAGWLTGALGWAPKPVATGLILAATALAAVPIIGRALKALVARRLDADVLVAIAVIAASSIGEFLAAGEVAFIMLLGEQLEAYTTRRARRSIGSLLALVPALARVRREGADVEVPVTALRVGDIIVVRAGERIPADGIVRSGEASVNQAPVTGESMPVVKTTGDEVFIGTLNESGALIIEAQHVGEDTSLARIAQIVEAAQLREAPIQRSLDRLATWLVPVMLVLATGVYLLTQDVNRAITVLIVACPCALILATPTAVMAGIARAARAGVIIKGGQHLEAVARLRTIVFDKTGTLTHGQPEVADVRRQCHHTAAEMVSLAAIAEKFSSHPIARAIVRHAGQTPPDPATFASHPRGVVAEHAGQKLVVGHPQFLAEQSIDVTGDHHDILVAHDGKLCGSIAVADTLRPDARAAVAELRQQGIEQVVMLTGDHQHVALDIAGQLGIDDVQAGVLPEQKAAHIGALKQRGSVAMVGDGVNDAPALAVADVGIAMGVTGTQVAHEAADVALMADDLSKIAFCVGLSRQALRIIKQGLAFALVYNITMVTLAGGGHLHMIGGAIAHQFSSVLVILNAMRLLRYR